MRTGAVTASGGKYLARKDSEELCHIGARHTAYWDARLLDRLRSHEILVYSRPGRQHAFAERLRQDFGKLVRGCGPWQDRIVGTGIMVEASRLLEPMPL